MTKVRSLAYKATIHSDSVVDIAENVIAGLFNADNFNTDTLTSFNFDANAFANEVANDDDFRNVLIDFLDTHIERATNDQDCGCIDGLVDFFDTRVPMIKIKFNEIQEWQDNGGSETLEMIRKLEDLGYSVTR